MEPARGEVSLLSFDFSTVVQQRSTDLATVVQQHSTGPRSTKHSVMH